MKKIIIALCLLPMAGFGQSQGDDPFDVIGFKPFNGKEAQTIWEEGSVILGRQAECLHRGAIKHGGNQMGTVDYDCVGALQDSNTKIFREPVASFMSSFGNPMFGYRGAGQSHAPDYTMPVLVNPKDKNVNKRSYPVVGTENLRCQFRTPHGIQTDAAMDKEGFKREHLKMIIAEKYTAKQYEGMKKSQAKNNQLKFTYPKVDRSASLAALQKIGATACKAFQKEVGKGHSKFSEYSPGFGGHNVVVYSKELNSVAEALPYAILSNQKVIMASQDLNQSNIGSSDNGADQLANEISLPPYYDGNRGKNLVYGGSPLKKFQGMNEGPEGSAGMIAWQLCIEQTGDGYEYTPGDKTNPIPNESGIDGIEFGNQNTSIFMPNNIISPFPLVVKNGKIDEENTHIDYSVNPDGSVKLNTNAPKHSYGPRNSELSKSEKKQMTDNASAMRLKVSGFVDNIFDNPKKDLVMNGTSLNIMSCANKLTNQKGYKNWDTEGNLQEQDGNNRISFEELSKLRSEAKGIVAKKMLEKEIERIKGEVDLELKQAKATLNAANNRTANYSQLENKVKYLENKYTKVNSADFSKLSVNIIDCGSDGSVGPDPYFNSLKQKYGSNVRFPKKSDYPNQSAYFSQLNSVSKQLKKMDVEAKLKQAQSKLATFGTSNADKLQTIQYEKWIKSYKEILAGKDGSPGYLSTPVINKATGYYNNKFPCNMHQPSDPLDCDLIEKNNRLLDGFKVESLALDLQLKDMKPDEDIIKGYHSKPDNIFLPGKGKMYYAAVMCNRKYVPPKKDKKQKDDFNGLYGSGKGIKR